MWVADLGRDPTWAQDSTFWTVYREEKAKQPGGTPFVLKGIGLIAGGIAALFVLGTVILWISPPSPSESHGVSDEDARQAVLNYVACPNGVTVVKAASLAMITAGAQKINGSYATIDHKERDTDVNLVVIKYTAANGSDQDARFTYNQATHEVNAANDDGLSVLRLVRAGC